MLVKQLSSTERSGNIRLEMIQNPPTLVIVAGNSTPSQLISIANADSQLQSSTKAQIITRCVFGLARLGA